MLDSSSQASVSVNEAVRWLSRSFEAGGLPTPGLDARLLVAHGLDLSREDLILRGDAPLTSAQVSRLESARDRRLKREPVSRICGVREFWGLPFRLNAATLDPRPDSETLVSAVLTAVDITAPLRILDLGTGSGCLLLSLLSEMQHASGLGVDISAEAVQGARENAMRLDLANRAAFLQSDWFDAVEGRFDVIISNPPYIKSGDIGGLEKDVRAFDPLAALDGGETGFDAYHALIPQLSGRQTCGGMTFLEVGAGQAEYVSILLANHGFWDIHIYDDLGGTPRVVTGKRHA